MEGVKVFSFLF